MKASILAILPALIIQQAIADMVPSSEIENKKSLETLCAKRSKTTQVKFFIDRDYLASERSTDADATFIASESLGLVKCRTNSATGKFGPVSYSPEQWYWRKDKPQQHNPSFNTKRGKEIAEASCLDAASETMPKDGLIRVVVIGSSEGGHLSSGRKAGQYDVVVYGRAQYKSDGPDLKPVPFTCLMSPMFEIKKIERSLPKFMNR